jgi:hypothetical protein
MARLAGCTTGCVTGEVRIGSGEAAVDRPRAARGPAVGSTGRA